MKLSDIQIGDTLQYERILDVNRGTYKTIRGTVTQKHGNNIEIDHADWWYWPQIKDANPQIVSNADLPCSHSPLL